MLVLEDVSKIISGFLLKNINLHLPKGYIMGLIGPNGSGKSTLIKTILNMYKKNSGRIIVDGIEITDGTSESKVKDVIGTVMDENFFAEGLSVMENANYFGRFYSNFHLELFLSYCKEFDLDPGKKLKKLSKGMNMKFQLAFALSHEAKLFLMDEPSANLDQTFQKELLQIMTEIVSDGNKSILLSTHLTEELDRIADYITFLYQGNQMFTGTKEDLLSKYKLFTGEPYKIKNLPEERIIYIKHGAYLDTALVKIGRHMITEDVSISNPSIEDLMYYMLKGEFHNA